MSRMRAMDAAFLAMERPAEPRHLGSLTIYAPGPDGPLTYEALRARLEQRLPLIASARRVVVEAPLRLGRPTWGPVHGFDLEFHLRRNAIVDADGPGALAELVADIHAWPLDRSRPLWELWFIEGLPDDRVALYAKVHMAALDDVTGAEVMTALLDTDPDGADHVQPAPPSDGDRGSPFDRLLTPVEQLRYAIGFPGRLADRTWRNLGSQLTNAGETIVETVQRTPGLESFARLLPRPSDDEVLDERTTGRAPRVSWNDRVTAHRRFATARLPLDRIIEVKRAAGTTVNDVVVAVCSGALRQWLEVHDELPSSPLVALVPMLVGTNGNHSHVAGLVVPLPTNVAEPEERLRRTSQSLSEAKKGRTGVPASVMQDVSMFAPPALAALAGRLVGAMPHRAFASPTVNLAITNVPGSRQRMYLAGRPLEISYPVLTINELSPLHIGLQSGPDAIGVGGLVCRDTMDDLDALLERMPVELELLERATGVRRARPRGGRKR
jgi:diacylglycerol O-acyltransferase / wax synthase